MERKSKYLLSLFVIAFFLLTVVSPTLINASPDEDTKDYSFYKFSSASSLYMSTAASPKAYTLQKERPVLDNEILKYGNGDASIGGNFLGFIDKDKSLGAEIIDFVSSRVSASSMTYSYKAYSKGESGSVSNIQAYMQYGYLLNKLGLDEVGSKGFSARPFIGGFMKFVYMCAVASTYAFAFAIRVLKYVNPFYWLSGSANVDIFKQVGSDVDATNRGWAVGIVAYVSMFYDTFRRYGMALTIPTLAIALFAGFYLKKNFPFMTKLKKFLIVGIFISMGMPMLGSLYTVTLNDLEEQVDSLTYACDRIIMSTFVDFGSWATLNRLSTGDNTTGAKNIITIQGIYNKSTGMYEPTPNSIARLRMTTLGINSLSYDFDVGSLDKSALDDPYKMTTNFTNSLKEGKSSLSGKSYGAGKLSTDKRTFLVGLGILDKYSSQAVIEPGAWETQVRSHQAIDTQKDQFEKLDDDLNVKNIKYDEIFTDKALQKWGGNPYVDGNLSVDLRSSSGSTAGAGPNNIITYYSQGLEGEGGNAIANFFKKDKSYKRENGLSSIGMYNYLSSNFGSNDVTVYSNVKSSSFFVKPSHYEVNLIGPSALDGAIYYINALSLLVCYAGLGFVFGLSIIFGTIKKSIKVLLSIPTAMLGSIRSIVKIVAYIAVIVMVILGTMFMYSLCCEMLFVLNDIILYPFIEVFTGAGNVPLLGNGLFVVISIFILAFSSVLNFIFFLNCLKLRKEFVKGVEEATEGVIAKLFDQQEMPSLGSHNPGGGLMKAIGAGGATYLAMNAMKNHHNNSQGGISQIPGSRVGSPGGGGGEVVASSDNSSGAGSADADKRLNSSPQGLLSFGGIGLPGADSDGQGGSGNGGNGKTFEPEEDLEKKMAKNISKFNSLNLVKRGEAVRDGAIDATKDIAKTVKNMSPEEKAQMAKDVASNPTPIGAGIALTKGVVKAKLKKKAQDQVSGGTGASGSTGASTGSTGGVKATGTSKLNVDSTNSAVGKVSKMGKTVKAMADGDVSVGKGGSFTVGANSTQVGSTVSSGGSSSAKPQGKFKGAVKDIAKLSAMSYMAGSSNPVVSALGGVGLMSEMNKSLNAGAPKATGMGIGNAVLNGTPNKIRRLGNTVTDAGKQGIKKVGQSVVDGANQTMNETVSDITPKANVKAETNNAQVNTVGNQSNNVDTVVNGQSSMLSSSGENYSNSSINDAPVVNNVVPERSYTNEPTVQNSAPQVQAQSNLFESMPENITKGVGDNLSQKFNETVKQVDTPKVEKTISTVKDVGAKLAESSDKPKVELSGDTIQKGLDIAGKIIDKK